MPHKFITRLRHLPLLLIVLSLIACAPATPRDDISRSPQQMYEHAQEALETANWPTAIDRLNALEARYPFGAYARRAQLELIRSHHQMQQWDAALSTADRFLNENPGHPDSAWVQYMRGLVQFDRTVRFMERSRWQLDRSAMDAEPGRGAFQDFTLLLRRYPDSEYAADARQRMIYLYNRLARHELGVVEYYIEREAWLAAANRASELIARYPEATVLPQALRLMEASYRELGLSELAEDTRRVYEASFGHRAP